MTLFPAQQNYDVAKLALEWAAARGLDRRHHRSVVRIKVPTRNRGICQVGFIADVLVLPRRALEVGEEFPGDVLQLTTNEHVTVRPQKVRIHTRKWSPQDYYFAALGAIFAIANAWGWSVMNFNDAYFPF